MTKQYDVLITSAPGMAKLLTAELAQLSLEVTPQGEAAVLLQGDLRDALRICLHSHLAERVLCRLVCCDVPAREAAVALAGAFDWQQHVTPADAVHVEVETSGKVLVNKLAVARDFIAAAPMQLNLSAKAYQALTIHLFITPESAELSIDLSGEPLQRRGYRLAGGRAPLRETLAAALLLSADWQADKPLLDPFCGSGTILIEAALMARRIAPGSLRSFFGFQQWGDCPADLWPALVEAAEKQQRPLPEGIFIKGFDADIGAMRNTRTNAERAGVWQDLHVEKRELGALKQRDFGRDLAAGLVVTNPPWGERLEQAVSAGWLHAALGYKIATLAPDWQVSLLGANVEVMDRSGMQLASQQTLLNGAEKNWIRQYLPRKTAPTDLLQPGEAQFELEEQAKPLFNRLRKNGRYLKGWLKQGNIQAYRLYDRDLPEFNFTLDIYGDKVLMQEWKAPANIPQIKVRERRNWALSAVRASLGCHREQLLLRTRERQKGKQQYHKLGEQGRYDVVHEGQARLLINLRDYQDSGLFLDHRLMRLRLAKEVAGKRFLNLFAYTASATVHAALGGAKASVTVDSSKRYLDWAANNLALNGFSRSAHQLVCTDVRRWLTNNHDEFDVIFCDPPTFSNSKGRDDFVVQRDHAELIGDLMKRLAPGGVLFFSCNFRQFKLDDNISHWYQVRDISRATLDKDFSRHPDIHHCFEIRDDI